MAFAAGFALARILEPAGTALRQDAWSADGQQLKGLDAGTVAQLIAKYLIPFNPDAKAADDWATEEAKLTGIHKSRLALLAALGAEPPGVGELLAMVNRHRADPKTGISDAEALKGFKRHKLLPEWHGPLIELAHSHLSPQDAASAVQRSVIPAPKGWLPVDPPTQGDRIKTRPQVNLDAAGLGQIEGLTPATMEVLTRLAGLPPGIHEALDLLNRGVIKEVDVRLAVAQGNLKNEWADALLALRRRLLSPNAYAELDLRGWISPDDRRKGAALSGMTPGDSDRLYQMLGRPLITHQVQTGIARGGQYDDPGKPDPPGTIRHRLVQQLISEGYTRGQAHAFVDSVQESNIRPEYYDYAIANRYSLPSPFVIRSLLTSGALTEPQAAQLFKEHGWKPSLAEHAAKALASGGTSKVKQQTVSHIVTEYEGGFISRGDLIARLENLGYTQAVAKDYAVYADALRATSARNSRISRIRSQFVAHALSDLEVKQYLDELKLAPELHDRLLSEWRGEREANIRTLTPAEVKTAYKGNIYTLPQAVALLERMGYSETDANVKLGHKPPGGIH